MSTQETLDEGSPSSPRLDLPQPGVVLVFSDGRPVLRTLPLVQGRLLLGRRELDGFALFDPCVSRQHADLAFDGRTWTVRDLNSRNGTFVDGQRVDGTVVAEQPRVLRLGQTVLLFSPDIRVYEGAGVVSSGGHVVGPGLRRALDRAVRAASAGENLLILGETGSGKELAAQTFHAASRHAAGPMVPVNCAAIPEGVAERLLFGARRGAYSGASADAEGYVQAAEGGVLFLDEVGELDPGVQAKLLRLLESREVMPVGASRAQPVDLQVCFATHRDLRTAIAQGRFREDLYYRIAQPELRLPPLRERLEEIPWLISLELARTAPKLVVQGRFVEVCLLRAWPGNVRELLNEVRRAVDNAQLEQQDMVRSDHLDAEEQTPADGLSLAQPPEPRPPYPREFIPGVPLNVDPPTGEPTGRDGAVPSREALEATLQRHGGNVSAAARELGLHRTQLYRLMKRQGLLG